MTSAGGVKFIWLPWSWIWSNAQAWWHGTWVTALISSLYSREQKRAKERLTVWQPQDSCAVVHQQLCLLDFYESYKQPASWSLCLCWCYSVCQQKRQRRRGTQRSAKCGNTKRKWKEKQRNRQIMLWHGVRAKCFPVGTCEDFACVVWLCHYQLAWFIGRCLLGWGARQGTNPNSGVAGGTATWC